MSSGYYDNIVVTKTLDPDHDASFNVTLKRGSFARTLSELTLENLVQLHDVLGHVIYQETQ